MRSPGPMMTIAALAWWLTLVAWTAAIIAPAATAMSAFTSLPAMNVTTERIETFFEEDTQAAGRFIAGYVTHPVFQASDRVQAGCAVVGVVLIVLRRGAPVGRPTSIARRLATVAMLLAVALLAWYLLGVSPSVESTLEAWRSAVDAGDRDAATVAYAAFDPWHRSAERSMSMILGAVVLTIVASGVGSTPARKKPR